jgi:pyruvate-formate lyase-activating enzyme
MACGGLRARALERSSKQQKSASIREGSIRLDPGERHKVSDFPRLVAIETTNHCNAKCVFCPNNALTRDRGPMTDDLFEKIVEECKAFPLEAVEPFLQGEPFSDPKILPRLEHLRRQLPKTKLRLYTNGYGMTPKKIDALGEIGLDHLYVSINTLDRTRYESTMGLSLERTLINLDYLTDPVRRNRIARKLTFRMTRLADTSIEEQDQFLRYARDKGARSFIVGLFNYKGDIGSRLPAPRYGCEHVDRLDILANGRVTLCCMDQEGTYGWGDARKLSVLKLFQHATARKYRTLHQTGHRRDIEPCGTCNLFWPLTRGLNPVEAVRMGIEYCAYRLRYRPIGMRAPRTTETAEAASGLVELRRGRT